jgi:hypothetical protein
MIPDAMVRQNEPAVRLSGFILCPRRNATIVQMFTYSTMTVEGRVPSNRYGTLEAIRERFRYTVDIEDLPPVNVEPEDFCPYWPGFARQGYKP